MSVDPSSINGFAKVAPFLTNPLVLVGFVLLLFFGVHRSLIKSGVLPPISKTASAKIVRLLLHYGFVIALLLILLGFGFATWKAVTGVKPASNEQNIGVIKQNSKGAGSVNAGGVQGNVTIKQESTPAQSPPPEKPKK